MDTKSLIITVISAAAAGALAGLLLAPAKGSETRKRIADSADDLRKRLRHLKETTNEELNELQQVFEHEVGGLKDDLRKKVLRLIETTKKENNHVKDHAMAN